MHTYTNTYFIQKNKETTFLPLSHKSRRRHIQLELVIALSRNRCACARKNRNRRFLQRASSEILYLHRGDAHPASTTTETLPASLRAPCRHHPRHPTGTAADIPPAPSPTPCRHRPRHPTGTIAPTSAWHHRRHPLSRLITDIVIFKSNPRK